MRDGFRGVFLQYFCEKLQAYLKLVEAIEMLRLNQNHYPITEVQCPKYLVDYPNDIQNIEGVKSNK